MTIAFDAKRITHNTTGLGNYSRFVVNALASKFPDDNYYLFSPSVGTPALYEDLITHRSVHLSTPSSFWARQVPTLWRSRGIASQIEDIHPEIFHGLSNEIPYGIKSPTATILTVHDLIYLRYPQYYRYIDRALYRAKYASSAKRADLIVAISQTTKEDLVNFLNIKPEKIAVVYQGCSPNFALAKDEDAKCVGLKYGLPKDYILYVGSIEPRKNLELIIKALALVKEKLADVHLIAVGRDTMPYSKHIQELLAAHRLHDSVQLLHNVPFSDLPGLYRGASLFCYPSRFEGFGIPIIEALSAGVPVIGATGSCLEEAGGDAQLYTHPDDHQMLATMIERVMCDTDQRRVMIQAGRKHLLRFQPQNIAQELMSLYRTLT